MEQRDEIIVLLTRIEQNQVKALQAQEEQLALVRAQAERSAKAIGESIDLQRVAVARQVQMRNIALPLIVVLLVLLAYLMLKWRML